MVRGFFSLQFHLQSRCWGKEYNFIQKAGRPRRWRTRVLQKPSYWVWMPVSFIEQRGGGGEEVKWKRPFILQNISWHGLHGGGDVLISSFLQPFTHRWAWSDCHPVSWTKALWFNIQAEGQGSLREAIMYDYNNKSNEKQRLKSKKQIQHGVKIGSSLLQLD